MFSSFSSYSKTIQYPYEVVTGPTSPFIPLSIIKEHLKLDESDTSEDSYLTLLGDSALKYAESYTRRTFLTTQFKTYRDWFPKCFTLRRSKLQSVDLIQYYKNDVLTTLSDTNYYATVSDGFSEIYTLEGKAWPHDSDTRRQAIHITFTAGYGAEWTDIPQDLRAGMLNHVAKLYTSRGDCCETTGTLNITNLPDTARIIYEMYKIRTLTAGDCCG